MQIMAVIIGRLCLDANPDAENEIEAVDLHSKDLYKIIQLKLKAQIDAVKDIEFYHLLDHARDTLIEMKVKENAKVG